MKCYVLQTQNIILSWYHQYNIYVYFQDLWNKIVKLQCKSRNEFFQFGHIGGNNFHCFWFGGRIFEQGCYATWRTWKSQKFDIWPKNQGKVREFESFNAWSEFYSNFKTKLLNTQSYTGTLNGLFLIFLSLKVKF